MTDFENSGPFWLGYRAYALDYTIDVCLFSRGSDLRQAWIDGWEFARFATAGLSSGCDVATNKESDHSYSSRVSS